MNYQYSELIDEYVGYCNEGNYQKAFNMLSEDCREYSYDNSVEKFMRHVLVKMPNQKKYSIQDYSNTNYNGKKIYIYEIKYTDDLLATGGTATAACKLIHQAKANVVGAAFWIELNGLGGREKLVNEIGCEVFSMLQY